MFQIYITEFNKHRGKNSALQSSSIYNVQVVRTQETGLQ